ncbi:MAG: HAD hydrolase family protein [Chloroflexota bacterium]
MIKINIPGKNEFEIKFLILDYNGTLALDGLPLPGVKEKLVELTGILEIHILTSDTHGSAAQEMKDLPVIICILESEDHSREKRAYVEKTGARNVIAIGNGSNDRYMLEAAAIGMAVMQGEGASLKTIKNADLVFNNILDALDCLSHPKRLVASLRE